MCIDYPNIVVLYKSENSKYMVDVDFMLGQRHRRLTYINPPLSIAQRKHDRSAPAQWFPHVGPVSQTMDQRQTNIGSVYRVDRLHTSKDDDPALGLC